MESKRETIFPGSDQWAEIISPSYGSPAKASDPPKHTATKSNKFEAPFIDLPVNPLTSYSEPQVRITEESPWKHYLHAYDLTRGTLPQICPTQSIIG